MMKFYDTEKGKINKRNNKGYKGVFFTPKFINICTQLVAHEGAV